MATRPHSADMMKHKGNSGGDGGEMEKRELCKPRGLEFLGWALCTAALLIISHCYARLASLNRCSNASPPSGPQASTLNATVGGS